MVDVVDDDNDDDDTDNDNINTDDSIRSLPMTGDFTCTFDTWVIRIPLEIGLMIDFFKDDDDDDDDDDDELSNPMYVVIGNTFSLDGFDASACWLSSLRE